VSTDVYALPPDLPVPENDGAADHLLGLTLPALQLESSQGRVDLRDFGVVYVYPRTGRPGRPMAPGWDEIPGARGCTPQSCAFRDAAEAFGALGVRVAGLSAQPLDDQLEERLLGAALRLPTFEVEGATLYKRLTLIVDGDEVVKVFYPVFPPDENAGEVLAWLQAQA
jgi:peroxiredoxin